MNIHKFLEKASSAYYVGNPILSDEEFDRLTEMTGFNSVGHRIENGVRHPFPMFSLKKYYLGEDICPDGYDIETDKLDGAAVDLIYVNKVLTLLLTRGDGTTGQDISHLIPAFPAPKTIDTDLELVSITGEVVTKKEVPNARNYAAGALNLNDVKEFETRDLYFVAYSVEPSGKPNCVANTYSNDMWWLFTLGFATVRDGSYSDIYPTDGKVFRVDCNNKFKEMGYTSNHPRGAYALKERVEGEYTTLLEVIWQVGKTGAVSPVAILDPVEIGGATISRATLHNIAYIRELDLEIGCTVEVIRSGEIIPRIVRRVD